MSRHTNRWSFGPAGRRKKSRRFGPESPLAFRLEVVVAVTVAGVEAAARLRNAGTLPGRVSSDSCKMV
jgi:hypothetical protein